MDNFILILNPGNGFDTFPPYPGIAFNTSFLSILLISLSETFLLSTSTSIFELESLHKYHPTILISLSVVSISFSCGESIHILAFVLLSMLTIFSIFCISVPFPSNTAYFIVWLPYDILLKSNVVVNPGFGFDILPPYPGIAFNTSFLSTLVITAFVSFPSIYIFSVELASLHKSHPDTSALFPSM